ncbi:MAG: ABC transporter permease [Actinomycetota bacterium]
MATAAITSSSEVVRTPAELRRAKILGIVYLVLGAFVLFVFAFGVEAGSTASFGLSRPTDTFEVPAAEVPARAFTIVIAVLFGFLGAVQLVRGFGDKANLVLGGVLFLFVLAFLTWAAAGKSFSMVGMLQATLVQAVPIALGAMAGILCERVAVINIAIEGQLLTGAFVGVIVGSATNLWIGLLAAVVSGIVLGWVLAVLAVRYLVDQIIIGVFINIFALGMTSFLTSRILVEIPDLNNSQRALPIKIPLLGDIPIIGPVLFNNNLFVYVMVVLAVFLQWALFRTRWGLRARAVGEKPRAADTVGINVFRTRYLNVMLGGAVAGFGGAFFTLGSAGRFDENITVGLGFIGLAAMIFGRYMPVGALAAALVFGFADSLQGKLAILQTPIPSEFLLMAPYVATIIVVAGLVGRSRTPAADGEPYIKQ